MGNLASCVVLVNIDSRAISQRDNGIARGAVIHIACNLAAGVTQANRIG